MGTGRSAGVNVVFVVAVLARLLVLTTAAEFRRRLVWLTVFALTLIFVPIALVTSAASRSHHVRDEPHERGDPR